MHAEHTVRRVGNARRRRVAVGQNDAERPEGLRIAGLRCDAQRQERLREVVERDSERPFHVCSNLLGDARGKRQLGGHGTEEMGNSLSVGRLPLGQADARPQLQANLLGQQESDLPRELDAIGSARVGKDRAHDALKGARPRRVDAMAEDQVILDAAHGGNSLRDEL